MLFLLIALIYAYWFFNSAKNCKKSNPVSWGIFGFFVFYITAILAMWAVSSLNPIILAASPGDGYLEFLINPKFFIPFTVDMLSAFIIANACAVLLRNIYLPPPSCWTFTAAAQAVAKRKTIGLPGKFPWFFMMIFPAMAMIGVIIMTAIMAPPPPDPHGMPSMENINWRLINVLIQTAGLSFILWRHTNWLAISLLWAGLMVITTFIFHIFFMILAGIFFTPSLPVFLTKFAVFFVVIASMTLSVRRWGTGFKILLASCLGARLLVDIPFILMEGHASFYTFVSPLLWGLVVVVALYLSFLFDGETNGNVEIPQSAFINALKMGDDMK